MRVKQPAEPGDRRGLLRASDPVTQLYESRLVHVVVDVVVVIEYVIVCRSIVSKQGSGVGMSSTNTTVQSGSVRDYISGVGLG